MIIPPRYWRFFRLVVLCILLVLSAGVSGAFLYAAIAPRLAIWSWTDGIRWPGLSETTPTIIERTEQIVLSPEEGLERFISAPRASVVSIVSVPAESTARTPTGMVVRGLSGILVTNDGLVATYSAQAPLTDGRKFTVSFADGNVSGARFIAYDPVVHVAYFRTERADTPALAFANSADTRPGRRFMVLAGTADPDEGKLTTGYIGERARMFNLSAKTVSSADEWEGVFLPDRPIDPGFIGGAAVAMNGELIGLIGTLTVDATDRTFILPANALRQSLGRVIGGGLPTRANVGAYYVSLTKETALALRISRDQGALIYTPSERSGLAVLSGSAAERAGLRYGDIVTSVNGQAITLDRPLSVALYEATDAVTSLTVLRDGDEIVLTLSR